MAPRTRQTFLPPIMQAQSWTRGITFPDDRPLLNLSQAAPTDPPPKAMRAHMADLIERDLSVHLYGPVRGLPELRAQIAAHWTKLYQGEVDTSQVAITSGCNQAFTATLAGLCGEGDSIIVPVPYYFNHKMACDMAGVELTPLQVGGDMLPDPEKARKLITPRTRAIVLISPNNPTGAEYPEDLLDAFLRLAQETGIKLIIDETYRDFHYSPGAPHRLFTDPDWPDTLIQLYSFSKAYRLTGHRVGAIIAKGEWLEEVDKYLDTVTICPAQIGQHGALWGMRNLGDWLAAEREEILDRRQSMIRAFTQLEGWQVLGCGAYFAYAKMPDDYPRSDEFVKRLVKDAGVLLLPGTMFRPEGDIAGHRELRIAFANVDSDGIAEFARRMSA